MLYSFLNLGWSDAVDVGVVTFLLWALIAWTRRVHATQSLLGLGFLGLFYLVSLQLELQLTAWIFQGFFAALVILLVVVFQDDLRRLFERIAAVGLRRRPPTPDGGTTIELVRAATQLGRSHTGALVVVPGREPLGRHVQGGVVADARVTTELLLSIFNPEAPGHDGAVVVAGDRIERFATHLPLSDDRDQLADRGTRHAAALGLAELSDALCVAVSEERGTISVAVGGQLRTLSKPEHLMGELRQHLARSGSLPAPRTWRNWRRGLLDGFAALVLAVGGWFFLVPGATMVQVTHEIPVVVENMPDEYKLEKVEPATVEVTFKGSRRAFLLTDNIDLIIDASLVRLGRRTFAVEHDALNHPEELEFLGAKPSKVRVSVRQN